MRPRRRSATSKLALARRNGTRKVRGKQLVAGPTPLQRRKVSSSPSPKGQTRGRWPGRLQWLHATEERLDDAEGEEEMLKDDEEDAAAAVLATVRGVTRTVGSTLAAEASFASPSSESESESEESEEEAEEAAAAASPGWDMPSCLASSSSSESEEDDDEEDDDKDDEDPLAAFEG